MGASGLPHRCTTAGSATVTRLDPAHQLLRLARLLPGLHQVERRVMLGLDGGERAELLRPLAKVQAGAAAVAAEPAKRLDGVRHRPLRLDPG